jgi:GTP-binding protein EngB required for normal cell division
MSDEKDTAATLVNAAPAPGARGALEGFRERKLDVTLAVQDLADVAQSLGAATIHERVSTKLVKKLEEDRFHLVVVGEFNHGKTTFVNALLGAPALPTGVTPTTATIHHLNWGETPSAKIVHPSGESTPIEFEAVRSFMVGGEGKVDEVDRLEVSYPAPLLKERIVLVDTPGVNDLSLQRADITYSYIPQSDAVLFLLDAGQILKESERAFIQDKILGQARDKIVFVVTKWDLLSPSEQEEALAYTKTNLAKFARLPSAPVVFPVSAQKSLAGDAEASGMPQLLDYLTHFLAEQRGRILLDNALGEALTTSETLAKGVDAKRRAFAMDEAELARRISFIETDLQGHGVTLEQRRTKIREEIATVKAWARRDLDRFVDDATRVALQQLDLAEPGDVKTHYQGYLEALFKGWAEAETKEIGTALEGITERTIALVREDAQETAKRVSEQLGTQLPSLKVEVDSMMFDVGVLAMVTVGIATLLSGGWLPVVLLAGAPVLGWFARERIKSEYKRIAKDRTPEVLREVAGKVGPKIDEMVDDFANKLDAWVVSAGEELHREMLEVLKAAKEARSHGVEKSASVRAETEVQSAKLVRTKARLEELRAGLWGDALKKDAAEVAAHAPKDEKGGTGGAGEGGGPPPPVNAQGGAA